MRSQAQTTAAAAAAATNRLCPASNTDGKALIFGIEKATWFSSISRPLYIFPFTMQCIAGVWSQVVPAPKPTHMDWQGK